ncbi:MAG: DUF4064 domain-containing protein [Bacillus sp. (in: firmicutes)]|uniref:DUF4064 domain-containing protein n=1 Tax=Sporolactobacillus sp. STSJ-5 TaxID=2965076 RepID=UPI0021053F13|nr:DUF4064 domain-containing protein [Sporolactobacillus sp. STSJ-5]MCQ2008580.1 hypothetical protein [Sporolactobacillus sp. STSJ-5]
MAIKSTTGRVPEMVLGIIGGVFGIIAGILAMSIGSLAGAFGQGGSDVIGLGLGCMFVSVLAIIFSCIINKNRILFGVLILVCGILNIIFVSMFGILSGLLIIIAGILALVRK